MSDGGFRSNALHTGAGLHWRRGKNSRANVRRTQSISHLVTAITAILVVALVSVFAWQALRALAGQREAAHVKTQVAIARDIVLVREALRVELGVIVGAMWLETPATPATLKKLEIAHSRSRALLRPLEDALEKYPVRDGVGDITPIRVSHASYDALLPRVMAALKQPKDQRPRQMEFDPRRSIYELIAEIDRHAMEISRNIASSSPAMSELMKVGDLAWFVRSYAGEERGVMSRMLSGGTVPDRQALDHLAHTRGAIDGPWQFIGMAILQKDFPAGLHRVIKNAETRYFIDYRAMREKMMGDVLTGRRPPLTVPQWQDMTAPALGSLMAVSRTALDIAASRAGDSLVAATRELYQALAMMLVSIALAMLGAVYVIFRVVRPLRRITQALNAANAGQPAPITAFEGRADEIGQFSRALNLFQRNVAEKRTLEMEVVRKNVEMEAAVTASRIKSEFLANMSHELRTPLNAVIGFSDMMLHRAFGPLPEKYEEYARLIHESGSHLLHLVSDILDLAKIEAGKMVLDIKETDLGGVVESCLQLSAGMADGRQVRLIKDMPDAAVLIHADSRACKQILLNLLSNAVKFSKPGGSVKVSLEVKSDFVRLRVRDKGIGIPDDVLPRLGKAFEQAANDPMLAREGTGLGLALVRQLVDAHGGTVHLASAENVGTCVTVELPLRAAAQQAA
jgi:signal transduction histidine kinase